MKRCAFLLLMLSLFGWMTTPTLAGTGVIVDEGWVPSANQFSQGGIGYQGLRLMERPDYTETASALRARSDRYWVSCASLRDAACAGSTNVTFTSLLQPCATTASMNCIAEFGVLGTDGNKIAASFTRSFPAEAWNKYPADAAAGLPVGGPGGLWTLPDNAGLPVSLHYVRASVQGKIDGNGKAVFADFAASLTPVSMTTMECSQNQGFLDAGPYPCTDGDFATNRNPNGMWGFVYGSGWDQNLDCEMSGNADYVAQTAECALRKPALLDTKYYLSVRLAQSPQGWMHGRLADADANITAVDGVPGAVNIAIVGKPVRVPVVFKVTKFSDVPTALQSRYQDSGGWSSANGVSPASDWGAADVDSTSPSGRNRLSIPDPYGPVGLEELEAWMPYMSDTSTADRTTWSLRTLRAWERERANSCIADTSRVTGLVLTNATQYLAGAPAYNSATGTLDYKVAAPHFMSNGDVFSGSYELIMRADVAQCIYKFADTNVTASIGVVDATGVPSNATTTVTIKDGWVRLTASGFTHSSPTVKVAFKAVVNKKPVQVKVKKTISAKAIAKAAKITLTSKSRVSLKVSAKSKKVCSAKGSVLRGLKKGACEVTVRVVTGKKKVTKKITIAVV